jgi:hypothetical protein
MEALKIRRLPVINKSKRMIGILSLGDVSHSASGDLLSDALERGVIEAVITGRSPSDAGALAPCPSRLYRAAAWARSSPWLPDTVVSW